LISLENENKMIKVLFNDLKGVLIVKYIESRLIQLKYYFPFFIFVLENPGPVPRPWTFKTKKISKKLYLA